MHHVVRWYFPIFIVPDPKIATAYITNVVPPGMLRPRGLCGLEAKLFGRGLGFGLVVSGLGLGLVASGLGIVEIGLEAKLFGLGLVVAGLGLGLVASGLGLVEVASNMTLIIIFTI